MRNLVLLHIFSAMLAFVGQSQYIEAEIEPNQILIGEITTFTLKLKTAEKLENWSFPELDNPIQVRETGNIKDEYKTIDLFWNSIKDTVIEKEGQFIYQRNISLQVWDSAFALIPPIPIELKDTILYSNPVILKVDFPAQKEDIEIYDIEEMLTHVEIEKNIPLWQWISAGIILLIITGLIIYFIKKKKSVDSIIPKENIPIHIAAIKSIEKLEEEKMYERNLKEYYFQISLVLRRYLSLLLKERIAEKTTSEIELLLKKHSIAKNVFPSLSIVLNQSDMVKFAKEQPTKDEIIAVGENAKKIVLELHDSYRKIMNETNV